MPAPPVIVTPMARATVIIVNYNGAHLMPACLAGRLVTSM